MAEEHKKGKFNTPFYNVCACRMVKGINSPRDGWAVKVINKQSNSVLRKVEAHDREEAFSTAFRLEMEIIQDHIDNSNECEINPNAMRAYRKHQAWKRHQPDA